MNGKKEFGDYQTPPYFALEVCEYLKNVRKISPKVVIEPTCGIGNFLESSLCFNADEYFGIEINADYCNFCREKFDDNRIKIINADFFNFDVKSLFSSERPVLIVGNPPWVNNSFLSSTKSKNLPKKTNFKNLKGIDAMTGMSNFDICENMILQIINQFCNNNATIAMLCKTSVARNVFKELIRTQKKFLCCDIVEFDAKKIFGVCTSACLLFIQLAENAQSNTICNVFDFKEPKIYKSTFGYVNNKFFSDLSLNADDFDGKCQFEWRQGVKHDATKVMVLDKKNDKFYNEKNEIVDIENDLVFPLVKSSMIKSPIINNFSKYVIMTQKKVGENTEHIKTDFPKTWEYLNKNSHIFQKRKSIIYKNAPNFSMFGVGDYSYSKFKVGISGFYKEPLFAILYSQNEKPMMLDDTCYFICFNFYDDAYVALLYLNSLRVQKFLKSISFNDSKRPWTKKILERIDFSKITSQISFEELKESEIRLNLNNYLTESMLANFKIITQSQQKLFDFKSPTLKIAS